MQNRKLFVELIDTLWNVNADRDIVISIAASSELIDTLWNVNPFTNGVFKGGLFELIDTLWNVNEDIK